MQGQGRNQKILKTVGPGRGGEGGSVRIKRRRQRDKRHRPVGIRESTYKWGTSLTLREFLSKRSLDTEIHAFFGKEVVAKRTAGLNEACGRVEAPAKIATGGADESQHDQHNQDHR